MFTHFREKNQIKFKKTKYKNTNIFRALIMAIQIYRDACSPCIQIARHAILGNSISILFDVLLHSLQVIKRIMISTRSISHLIYMMALWLNAHGPHQAIKVNRCAKKCWFNTFQGHSHYITWIYVTLHYIYYSLFNVSLSIDRFAIKYRVGVVYGLISTILSIRSH